MTRHAAALATLALALAGCASDPEPVATPEGMAEVICAQMDAGVAADEVALPESDLTEAQWESVPTLVDDRCVTDYADHL